MDVTVLIIFALVYLGMMAGGLPGLALDRTGVALCGAIALVALGKITPHGAVGAVNVPTLSLLFGLMVVSAQLRLGGFYSWVAHRLATADHSPPVLMAMLIAAAAGLSAVLANDIVCLAMSPLLIAGCSQRKLNPVPFLLALACAANVGSATTLIGNPQNMLVGQTLPITFIGYLAAAGPPAAIGLLVVWAVIAWQWRGKWAGQPSQPPADPPRLNAWETAKGLAIMTALGLLFLFTKIRPDVLALGAAGLLLMSRKMSSRQMLAMIDWQLLVLFLGLFVVNASLRDTRMLDQAMAGLGSIHINVSSPPWLFAFAAVLANLVSNVPGVMLLLPAATHPPAPAILALSSTLAGNFIVVGSIANIIVLGQAEQMGVHISWKQHAKSGVPVTLLTLAIAAAWLWATN